MFSIFSNLIQKGKLFAAFLFFIFSPFILKDELIDPSNTLRGLLLPILLLAYLYLNREKEQWQVPPFYFRLFFGSYLLIVSTGFFFALNTAEVLNSLTKLILFYACLCLSLDLWKNQPLRLLSAIRYVSISVSLLLIYLLLQLPDLSRQSLYSVQLFYEHKNLIASFLFILLAFTVLQLQNTELRHRWFSILNFVLLFTLLVLLQVRSVYIALLVTAAVLLFFRFRTTSASNLLLPVLIFLTAFIFLTGPDKLYARLKPFLGSMEERVQLWSKTVEVIQDDPIFGCGAGNWQFNFSKHSIAGITNLENGITAQHPHNELLAIWSENGSLGLLALGLLIAFLARHTVYALKKGSGRETKIYLAFLCGFFIEAQFSFPKERILLLTAFAFLLGGFMDSVQLSGTVSRKNKGRFALIILALIFVTYFFRVRGEYYTKVLLTAQQAKDARGMIAAGKKASSPFYTTDPTSSPIASYIGAAYFDLNNTDSLLFYCNQAATLAPFDYEVQSNLGFALTRAGKPDEARQHLREALRIHPRDEGAWLNLVVLDYSLKNYEDALNELMQIPDFESKYPQHLSTLQKAFAESLEN